MQKTKVERRANSQQRGEKKKVSSKGIGKHRVHSGCNERGVYSGKRKKKVKLGKLMVEAGGGAGEKNTDCKAKLYEQTLYQGEIGLDRIGWILWYDCV